MKQQHNCAPVFISPDVKEKYYKGKDCANVAAEDLPLACQGVWFLIQDGNWHTALYVE